MDKQSSTEATPPSTPTTQASSSSTSNKAACDSILQRFDKRFFSYLREKCTTENNGNVKLTSEPEGKPTLKTEMLISNKDKSAIWWAGYHSGYATGETAARYGSFIATKTGKDQFATGFDYGYKQGYQIYKVMHTRLH